MILTNAQKNNAADAEPTLKLQQSANEGGSNNNAGSVSVLQPSRKIYCNVFFPEYKSYSSKRKQAFDAIYSKHLMSDTSFAKPASMTAEEWKRTLIKWFDNNVKKSGQTVKRDVEAQSKHVSTADENTLVQNHIPHPANPPSTNQSDHYYPGPNFATWPTSLPVRTSSAPPRIEEVVKDPYVLYRDLSDHLNESLKDTSLVLNDLKLRTEIPIDSEGLAWFPTISNLDNVSRSQLRQVYEDFMTAIWFQAGYTGSVDYNAIETNPNDYYEPTLLPAHMKLKRRVFVLKKPSPVADVEIAPPPIPAPVHLGTPEPKTVSSMTADDAPVAHLRTPKPEVVSTKVADDNLHTPLATTEQKTPEAPALPIPSPNAPNAAHPMIPLTDTAMASPSATAVDLSLDENNGAPENIHNDEDDDEDWMDAPEETDPPVAETTVTPADADANVSMNHTDAGTSSGPDPEGAVGTDITKTNEKKGAKKMRGRKAGKQKQQPLVNENVSSPATTGGNDKPKNLEDGVQAEQVDVTHMPLRRSKRKIAETEADGDGTDGTQRKHRKKQ
ncbi:hypothetical protein BT96DRAFT_937180 [Gymnopus androsaceus JB14]|uniref:Uncharacterized protein n=1 Tax=Gymnopus androsaceus JB14 TaxID=1447944 RepID=A0A6A4HZJ4_9AGAR|nr:hypothetical protein BT96DRAFT_937180 [Gymnopus androsaceus JB14]